MVFKNPVNGGKLAVISGPSSGTMRSGANMPVPVPVPGLRLRLRLCLAPALPGIARHVRLLISSWERSPRPTTGIVRRIDQ
ncbi:hypothetical protein ACHAO4_000634 [Trichoderma viride]